jgi:hypothetical protein
VFRDKPKGMHGDAGCIITGGFAAPGRQTCLLDSRKVEAGLHSAVEQLPMLAHTP